MTAVVDAKPARAKTHAPQRSKISFGLILLGLVALLLMSIAAAVSFGSVRIPVGDVWAIVIHRMMPGAFESWWTEARSAIVVESRLPRSLTAAVVGASLALSAVWHRRLPEIRWPTPTCSGCPRVPDSVSYSS